MGVTQKSKCGYLAFATALDYFASIDSTREDLADITIRRLDEKTKKKLRVRAAQHGHSMEEEARQILRSALTQTTAPANLYDAIRRRVELLGGHDLDIQPRSRRMREPPRFE